MHLNTFEFLLQMHGSSYQRKLAVLKGRAPPSLNVSLSNHLPIFWLKSFPTYLLWILDQIHIQHLVAKDLLIHSFCFNETTGKRYMSLCISIARRERPKCSRDPKFYSLRYSLYISIFIGTLVLPISIFLCAMRMGRPLTSSAGIWMSPLFRLRFSAF